ncbi:MAG: hypothetical protein ACTHMY_05835 [Solirubrobacteraceae bacterium]
MNGAAVADAGREPEDRHTAVAAAVIRAAENIDTRREKSWRLQVAAPRWALVRGEHEAWIQCGLFLVALLLAAGGVFLAWHASDQVAAHSRTAPPLTDQIGPWAVAIIVIGGAVAAAIAAFRSAKMHLDMEVNPAPTPAPQRAVKLVPAAVQSEDSSVAGESAAQALPPSPTPAQSAAGVTPSTAPVGGAVVDPRTTVSPKVVLGTVGTLASASFWTVAAATFWHTVEPVALTALGTVVTAAVGAATAWWKTDPLRVAHVNQSRPAPGQQ